MPANRPLAPAALALFAILLASCAPSTRPVIKIALVAPFEGRYRAIGYEVIYAFRLAVREANAAGGIAGHSLALVVLDDGGQAEAAIEQAHKVAADPGIVAVSGHWLDATTLAAAAVYESSGLAHIASAAGPLPDTTYRLWPNHDDLRAAVPAGDHLDCIEGCPPLEDLGDWLAQGASTPGTAIFGPPLWAHPDFANLAGAHADGVFVVSPAPSAIASGDPAFVVRYQALANGLTPGPYAVLAYDTARLIIDAIDRAGSSLSHPSRETVANALGAATFAGLSGDISFDAQRDWAHARGWLFQWRDGRLAVP